MLFVQAMLIVSDKENDKWRILRRSGLSLRLILASKTMLTCAATLATFLCCAIVVLLPIGKLALSMAFMVPVLLTFLGLGTLIGFWYQTMQDVIVGKGFTGLLLVLIVVYPIIASTSRWELLQVTYRYYPTGLLSAAMNGLAEAVHWPALLKLLAGCWFWALALMGLVYRLYRRECDRE